MDSKDAAIVWVVTAVLYNQVEDTGGPYSFLNRSCYKATLWHTSFATSSSRVWKYIDRSDDDSFNRFTDSKTAPPSTATHTAGYPSIRQPLSTTPYNLAKRHLDATTSTERRCFKRDMTIVGHSLVKVIRKG